MDPLVEPGLLTDNARHALAYGTPCSALWVVMNAATVTARPSPRGPIMPSAGLCRVRRRDRLLGKGFMHLRSA